MKNRPDWVCCIEDTRADREGKTLCGKTVDFDFTFTGVDHWFQNGAQDGRLVGCPDCVKIVRGVVNKEASILK